MRYDPEGEAAATATKDIQRKFWEPIEGATRGVRGTQIFTCTEDCGVWDELCKPEPKHSQAHRWEGATYALLTKEGRPCSTQDIRHGPREMLPKRPGSISLKSKAGGA